MALLPFIGSLGPYSNVRIPQGYPYGNAWTLANRIIYVPVRIPEDATVKRVYWTNHNSVAGNVNVGLYSQDGTKQWECGSTAQSGTEALQFVDLSPDQSVAAGQWLIALQASSTSARFYQYIDGAARLWGVLTEDAASFALPATATFASDPATNYLPVFGLDLRG